MENPTQENEAAYQIKVQTVERADDRWCFLPRVNKRGRPRMSFQSHMFNCIHFPPLLSPVLFLSPSRARSPISAVLLLTYALLAHIILRHQ